MPEITQYFAEIQDEIGFIAQNDGYIIDKNEKLFANKLEHRFIEKIVKTVRVIPGARAVLSAK